MASQLSGIRLWAASALALGAVSWALVAGCSSSNNNTVTSVGSAAAPISSRTVVVAHTPGPAKGVRSRGVPPEVDTLEFTGRDASGATVYGWTRRDYAQTVTLTDVPASVRTLHIDYLRNAGYALRTVDVPVDLSGGPVTVVDPPHTAATAATSTFQFTGSGPYQLVATYPEGSASPSAHNIKLKGVGYAPTPIGANINFLQLLSDLFYDLPPTAPSPATGLPPSWLPIVQGSPTHDVNPAQRGDLEDIRTNLNCNAIRVYAVMAHPLSGNNTTSLTQTYAHEAFLDQCWNNGHNPVFVLADFPMPEFMFFSQDPQDPYGASWWEQNLVDTVSNIGKHPALLGILIMNEHIGSGNSFITTPNPNPTPSPIPSPSSSIPPPPSNLYQATASTDYFYRQCQNFIKDIKGGGPFNPGGSLAPGKLVGWAINDNPTQMNYINYAYDTSGTKSYASYLSGFDFWGVNTYQPVILDSVLSPNAQPTGSTPGSNSSYAQLTNCQKPVIFTEIGWSAAVHAPSPSANLQEDTTGTVPNNVANTISSIIGQQAFANSNKYSPNLFVGSFYFEYCDEWWKTSSNAQTWVWNTALNFTSGPFPNGLNIQDEAAFGINGLTLGPGRAAGFPNTATGPSYPLDVLGRQLPQVIPSPAPSPGVSPLGGSNPRAAIQKALYDVYKSN